MAPEQEFDQAFESALQDLRNLVRFLDGVSEAQARWKPPDGEWSVLEGLEHILLTDAFFQTTMIEALRGAEASGRWDNTAPGAFKMTLEALRRREQGHVDAPAQLHPKGRSDFRPMIAELLPAREATREALLRWRGRDLSRLVVPSPRYGALNAYERIAYSGIHDALHHEQMGRVTRQAGFPAK
ncbi:MAG: DinB family protein [Nitrospinota bacterium]